MRRAKFCTNSSETSVNEWRLLGVPGQSLPLLTDWKYFANGGLFDPQAQCHQMGKVQHVVNYNGFPQVKLDMQSYEFHRQSGLGNLLEK